MQHKSAYTCEMLFQLIGLNCSPATKLHSDCKPALDAVVNEMALKNQNAIKTYWSSESLKRQPDSNGSAPTPKKSMRTDGHGIFMASE